MDLFFIWDYDLSATYFYIYTELQSQGLSRLKKIPEKADQKQKSSWDQKFSQG